VDFEMRPRALQGCRMAATAVLSGARARSMQLYSILRRIRMTDIEAKPCRVPPAFQDSSLGSKRENASFAPAAGPGVDGDGAMVP
jgi:hypothetical protein